jgi:hypothetical protein
VVTTKPDPAVVSGAELDDAAVEDDAASGDALTPGDRTDR